MVNKKDAQDIKNHRFGMILDKQVYLSVLRDGAITEQRQFLKLSPSLIKIWEGIEATPFTRLMLEILNRGNQLVKKKVAEYETFSFYEAGETPEATEAESTSEDITEKGLE